MWNHRATWGKHTGYLMHDGSILMYNSMFKDIHSVMKVLNQYHEYTNIVLQQRYKLFNLTTGEYFDENVHKWIAI